jgi:hypothetical protein
MRDQEPINGPEYFASLSDLIVTVHKMDNKVTKLYETLTGDKELGTEGMMIKFNKMEERLKELEKYKAKLAGIFIAAGFLFGYLWETAKNLFIHK